MTEAEYISQYKAMLQEHTKQIRLLQHRFLMSYPGRKCANDIIQDKHSKERIQICETTYRVNGYTIVPVYTGYLLKKKGGAYKDNRLRSIDHKDIVL